jgi:adenylate cyclase
MPEERVKRKLTAILSADVKGYSRLMSEDEVATVEILKQYRRIMAALIKQYSGRVVDSPGDNLLADFSSVTDAVQCAMEIQGELKSRNAELPENRRMEFRIGINLGDVIDEGERIYGEGINIASRLEGLSDEGGVCISSSVYNQVKNKLELNYEDIGEQTVKNIPDPIRVYCIGGKDKDAEVQGVKKLSGRIKKRHKIVMVALILLIASVAIFIVLRSYRSESPQPVETASKLKTTSLMPSKPSIAVLPFKNLSGDPEQEYFSDGITNDIITDLSRFRELLVIASNTSFTYKDKPVKVKDVGQELGVRYVLEGSVQKTGDKVRINAQFIDSTTGNHLWAERYERDLKEIFSVQDEIVQKIVAKLAVKITTLKTSIRLDVNSLQNTLMHLGFAYYLEGRYEDAIRSLEKGVIHRPNFLGYHIALAAAYVQSGRLEDAKQSAVKVLQLDPFFEIGSYGTDFRNPADRQKIIEGLQKAGLK